MTLPTETLQAIKPCPFCGSDGKIIRPLGERLYNKDASGKAVPPYYGPQWFRVRCSNDRCSGMSPSFADEGAALAAWNRRTPAPYPARVGVKRLEWSDWSSETNGTYADTILGRYAVTCDFTDTGDHWSVSLDFDEFDLVEGEQDAKAKCQAHYETRIRSALVVNETAGGDTQAGLRLTDDTLPARVGVVTEEMVERFEEKLYGRHARGFIMRPLIDPPDFRPALKAALSVTPNQGEAVATHRHKKRGSEYVLIGIGKMQAENWEEVDAGGDYVREVDMSEVAIYRSVDDGSLWVRPREEFEDGRFEVLSPSTPTSEQQ